ncbi:hypothetical protein BGW37DRAFT_531576 [Umbelopsis sp. PMI_123]|nr:hypothetical protein BGW37DRAFT_531576 [Umbelopsis sp. PMI_123]
MSQFFRYLQLYKFSTKVFASVPLIGIALLLTVGLDQAPNTDRLRLVYLTEEEEMEVVTMEIDQLLGSQSGLIAPKDNEYVQWLQSIVDNIARVSLDDIRDPVRKYDPEDPMLKTYEVDIICDSSTLNAMCAGNKILVYDLMLSYLGFDTDMMAVILSHEIAHSIQRHFVETHGMASFMLMLGDISRGLLWTVTESLGPYINQKLNELISGFIAMETETTYNRGLEKEADLVGLMLMAKAGYDPRTALTVWSKMAELDGKSDSEASAAAQGTMEKIEASHEEIKQTVVDVSEQPRLGENENIGLSVKEFVERLLTSWFGSTHPPSTERLEYMRDHLPAAIEIYEKAIAMNGKPIGYESPYILEERQEDQSHTSSYLDNIVFRWLTSLFGYTNHTGDQTVDSMTISSPIS